MESTVQQDKAWLSALTQIDTAVIADVLDECGYPNQVISRKLRPNVSGKRFAGYAACVKLSPRDVNSETYDDFSSVDALAQPDVVIVLGCSGVTGGAVVGEFMAREFQRRGATALLTDGAARDSMVIAQMDFTVYSDGTSPMNGARRLRTESTSAPVRIAGEMADPVVISPGDLIVADDDGVVVVPLAVAELVLEAAAAYASAERDVAAAMVGGMPRVMALKTHNRVARIRPILARIASGANQ